jgi:hypothetical protein
LAQRIAQTIGGADEEDGIADENGLGVDELRHGGAAGHHRELEDGDVGPLLGRVYPRGHGILAEELDGDVLHLLHHMRGGRHLPVGRDQDARADLLEAD